MSGSYDKNSVPRLVIKTILPNLHKEDKGAVYRQGITKSEHKLLDPFVSLVEFTFPHSAGYPDHPHRGFESVTYMFQGGIIHNDLKGHSGTIRAGDVQWLTSGRGIIHSEMPEEEINNGLQLWINLPSKEKMMEPKYKIMSSLDIPRAEEQGVEVKVISGDSMGIQSLNYTRTPTMFLDFTLKPGSQTNQDVPESWTALAYIIEGDEGVFGSLNSSAISANHVVVFGSGDLVSVWNKSTSKPLRFILIAGEPIGESVVQCGPFVMNSQAETDMAFADYQNGRNGFEMAKCLKSQ